MSEPTTVGDLLEELKDYDPSQRLRFSVTVEHGRSVTGDTDSDWYVDSQDGEVVIKVSGEEDSETGWWE